MAWIVYGVVIMLMYENVKYLCRTVDHISYCHSLLNRSCWWWHLVTTYNCNEALTLSLRIILRCNTL